MSVERCDKCEDMVDTDFKEVWYVAGQVFCEYCMDDYMIEAELLTEKEE